MSKSFVCKTCLSFSTKTHDLNNSQLQEIFEKLTSIRLNTLEKNVICYICYAQLQRCRRFAEMSWKSDVVLTELISKGVEITQEKLTRLGWKSAYTVTPVDQFYNGSINALEVVKEEPTITECNIAVKVEKIEESEVQIYSILNKEVAVKTEPVFIENEILVKEEFEDMWLEEDIDVEGEVTLYDNFVDKLDVMQHEEEYVDIEDICVSDRESLNINTITIKEQLRFECNRKQNTKKELQKHEKTHKNKVYTCDICDKTFAFRSKIVKHIKTHSEVLYTCMLCDKGFRQESYLKKHVRIHTQDKPYICDHCGKQFTDKSSLNRHTKIHCTTGANKTHSCDTCSKKFLRKAHLKLHLVTHSGLKPYTCNVCNHSFTQQNSLKGHMRIHTGEKTHHCKQCGKGFYRKGHLHQHMSVHTSQKPFVCDNCDRKFTVKRSLVQHTCKYKKTG